VFDYDWAFRDDFIGEAIVDVSRLEPDRHTDLVLDLVDPSAKTASIERLGQLSLSLRLEATAARSLSLSSSVKTEAAAAAVKSKASAASAKGLASWAAVVNVLLIEAEDLLAMDSKGTSDPYCKVR
jgi:Ca2+-dependent lipid-binding protein